MRSYATLRLVKQTAPGKKVAVDAGHARRDTKHQLFPPLRIHRLLVGSQCRIGIVLVCKSEDRHQQPPVVFVIEQLGPIFLTQFHPAHKSQRPIIRMRNTSIILQKKRHERFT